VSTATAPEKTLPLSIGGGFTIGDWNEAHIVALAAATPRDSVDPVDIALVETVDAAWPELAVTTVTADDVDPASHERRFSFTMVRDFPVGDGQFADLVVMRGSLEAVLAQVPVSRKNRGHLRRNAAWADRNGWRPLAVATAPVGPGDEVGDFTLQGFVEVGIGKTRPDPDEWTPNWVQVKVWSVSLRLQHWLNVATIFVLSCSGYLIMDPFFGPEAREGVETGYQMGWIRFIHFTAAFVWVILGASRVVSAFTSRDMHLRWTEWWPLKRKQDIVNLGKVLQHYALIKVESPLFVAHNPLQHLTYAGVYVACGIQMLSGFALYGLYHPTNPFWALISTPVHIFGTPFIRLFHTLVMFALWAFVIVHVYLAVRADSLERHGGISSMINGGVWLRRGSKPVDAPEIE
jgi:Ni/Fe-hydrogenase b-type cytochrome subunit